MPTSLVENFIGPAYTARSQNIADDSCLNMYVETTRLAGAVKSNALIGTPGLKLDANRSVTNSQGCRGMFTQDVLTAGLFTPGAVNVFYVIGTSLYVSVNGGAASALVSGTIPNDNQDVTFASNGAAGGQIALCAGGNLYIINAATLAVSAAIAVPFGNEAVCVGFIDGYFVLLQAGTATVWFSNLENGLIWDALDFFTRSHVSDEIVGMVVVDSRIWTFGTSNIELFYDTGDGTTPFAPYPGSVLPFGAVNYMSIAVSGNTIVWLALPSVGSLCMMAVSLGASPQPVSNPAIDMILANVEIPSFVTATAYRDQGHAFVLVGLPAISGLPRTGETWCIDLEESGRPWHQRSSSGTGPWRASGICVASSISVDQGAILVGDYANGNIYQLDLGTYTDNGTAIMRQRRAPYISATNQWMFLDSAELGLETGVGNGASPDPQITLEVSRDSGNTYSAAISTSMGKAGAFNQRAVWNRLGRVRADRLVLRVTSTEPVKQVWTPGLWLRATQGTGQL